jgi:hypothetical protein
VSAPPALPSGLRARVLAAAAAERVPSRSSGLRRQAVTVGVGFAVSVLVSVIIGSPDAAGRPMAYVAAITAAWGVVALAATLGGVARGKSMLGRPAAWRIVVAGATPVVLLAASVAMGMAWPATTSDAAGLHEHVICIVFAVLFALGPLAAFAFVRRGTDPVAPRLSGAAVGAAAGAWGALGIELHCGHAGIVHVVVGHVLPVVLLTAVGALVGDRLVATR